MDEYTKVLFDLVKEALTCAELKIEKPAWHLAAIQAINISRFVVEKEQVVEGDCESRSVLEGHAYEMYKIDDERVTFIRSK
jgi:hypothetical protein